MIESAMPSGPALSSLLGQLVDNAAQPFDAARSLPPAAYVSEDLLRLELARIFKKEWICIGRCAEIPEAGDYLSFEIAAEPIFAVRQDDGQIRVMANACLHRCARLVHGRGHERRFVCPYHAWTYGRDGSLLAAPHMLESGDFHVGGRRLPTLRHEIWEGFIYVTLSSTAAPLAGRIQGLLKVIGRYRLAHYQTVAVRNEVWETNWKCLVENFMDAYHVFKVHRQTFDRAGDAVARTAMHEGGRQWSYHTISAPADGSRGVAHADNTWLQGRWRHTTTLASVFPAHTMQVQPDMLWYLSIQPLGIDRLKVRWALSIPSEMLAGGDGERITETWLDLLERVNEEDRAAVMAVRAVANQSRAVSGPLSYLERNLWEFGRYLAWALDDAS